MQTIAFSGSIYGKIPPHLGCGGTKNVQLLLNVETTDKPFFELSGLTFEGESNWTEPAKLLFATDEEYIVLVKSPRGFSGGTLSIKRDLIKSVRYEGLSAGGASMK